MLAALPRVVSERLTVERVSDVDAFEALRQEWDELLAASDSCCVFLTWEWLYTWWKHLAEDRKLCILAVRRGSELMALAPLALRPRSLTRGCPLPVLEFLGSGFVGSDYLDFIVRKGAEDEASQALISHLAKERVPLKWTNLNGDRTSPPMYWPAFRAGPPPKPGPTSAHLFRWMARPGILTLRP